MDAAVNRRLMKDNASKTPRSIQCTGLVIHSNCWLNCVSKIEISCCHKNSSKYKITLLFATITHRLPPLRPHWTTTVLCSWLSWLSSCPCSAYRSALSCVCRFCWLRRSGPTRGRRRRFSSSVSWTWFSHQTAPRHRLWEKYSGTRVKRPLSRMVEYTVESVLNGHWVGR